MGLNDQSFLCSTLNLVGYLEPLCHEWWVPGMKRNFIGQDYEECEDANKKNSCTWINFYLFFFFPGWEWNPRIHLLLGYTPWLKCTLALHTHFHFLIWSVWAHVCGCSQRPEAGLGCRTLTINLIALSLTKPRATQVQESLSHPLVFSQQC